MTSRGERLAGALLLLVVAGLAVHNAAMAQLWELGVRGAAPWMPSRPGRRRSSSSRSRQSPGTRRRLPRLQLVDVLAATYAAVIVVYALVPQERARR